MTLARLLVAAGAVFVLCVLPADAADLTSVTIVDLPRPQQKWGYTPGTRRIQPGTWVTWSNDGQDAHTVTATDASFDSGELNPSEGFSWFFDEPGTFSYVCALHPWMAGKIVVGDGIAISSQPSAVSDPGPTDDGQPVDEQLPSDEG